MKHESLLPCSQDPANPEAMFNIS